ncbi:MAG TPA: class I SAM-dependent methyltransferase [Streptosporangiaceae bacterium]|nr:class I SAM-dependent methyltransferase [Streptosporangiaceae bacterium]
MSFEDVMTAVTRWMTATEALAAVGAELTLAQSGEPSDPEVSAALQAVSLTAGLPDLAQLPPPQRELVAGLVRMCLRQAQELVDDPGRAPGWTFTDPDILGGWGRGSMMVPAALAARVPELDGTTSFLDIGTGVGLLAIAAARTWPGATITGLDTWDPALTIAAGNIKNAGLGDRITLRHQDVATLDDRDIYDCVWFPTFFIAEAVLDAAVPRLVRSLRPGGTLVLGRMAPPPDPLAQAVGTLRTIRGGGADYEPERLASALAAEGCVSIRTLPRSGPAPLEYVIGQRAGSAA